MSKLMSDDFKIDETNALLRKVPGLGFSTASLVKTVGGDGGKIDPNTLQVENTNAAVCSILGNGFVKENLSEAAPAAASFFDIDDVVRATATRYVEELGWRNEVNKPKLVEELSNAMLAGVDRWLKKHK